MHMYMHMYMYTFIYTYKKKMRVTPPTLIYV